MSTESAPRVGNPIAAPERGPPAAAGDAPPGRSPQNHRGTLAQTPLTSTPATNRRFVQFPADATLLDGAFEVGHSSRTWSHGVPGPWGRAQQAEILGVIGALLHRYSQQLVVALDVLESSGWGREGRVALDLQVDDDTPVSALMSQAGEALRARARPDDGLAKDRSNVAVTFVDSSDDAPTSSDPAAQREGRGVGHDLHFILSRQLQGTRVTLVFNAKRFALATVERALASCLALLEAARRDPATPVGRLPLLGASEVRALTREQDSGTATYPATPVHQVFEGFAASQPEAIAVTFDDDRLTYAQLEHRANRLAHHLVSQGVGPEIPVAVCLRPSVDVLVSILAIFKARGLYFPLDPTHPEAFRGRMLDEAQPRLVVTQSALANLIPADRFTVLCLDTDADALAALPAIPPALHPRLDDAATLFYTSGTTGKPKGVVATQGNLAHYLHVAQQKYAFASTDVFCSLARYTFSISLFELLSPLCCGGRLLLLERDQVLNPDRLSEALAEVTVLHAGPSLLGSLFRHLRSKPLGPRTFPRMRHASSGGDLVAPSVMEELKRVFENAEIFVIYGSTEISCMGTTFAVQRGVPATRTFVGKPFPDVQVRVLDAARQLVPFGVVGEICFAGRGVTRGYLDRPDLTAEKFVELDSLRLYQMGDLGRLHADGNLEILGRRDFQVQLRGIRIELAGIEQTVLALGLAAQCAVVCRTLGVDDVRLVAFLVNPHIASVAAFRQALATELPDYMLPHHAVLLEAMPLTVNGKLDRNRLQEMPWDAPWDATPRPAPQDELERELAEVFRQVLGIPRVGVDESFFDLGGDSLSAVIAIQEIESALGLRLPPQLLFEHGTVRALATHARSSPTPALQPILLSTSSAHPPLFMLSGIHLYGALARRMGDAYSAYGVFVDREVRMLGPSTNVHSVGELAGEYVEIIRRAQPVGPYRLLGYSFAGIVAYEVAQELQRAGEEIRFLALVDAHLPEWTLSWKFRVAQLSRMRSVSPRNLAAWAARRLRERLWREGRPQFPGHQGDTKLAPLEAHRDELNHRAAAEYLTQIRPYAGAVTVITSAERLRRDPLHSRSCGWAPYAPEMRVHQIDADHFRLIRDEPYVSQMAAALLKDLQLRE